MKNESIRLLKSLNLQYSEQDIDEIAQGAITDEDIFYENIQKLNSDWNPTDEMFTNIESIPKHFDTEVGRFIQSRMDKIFNKYYFALLSNNVQFFSRVFEEKGSSLKKEVDVNDLCRISCLLGLRDISEFLFQKFPKECDPVSDKKILYCAICSKNQEIVRNIFVLFPKINLDKYSLIYYFDFIPKNSLIRLQSEAKSSMRFPTMEAQKTKQQIEERKAVETIARFEPWQIEIWLRVARDTLKAKHHPVEQGDVQRSKSPDGGNFQDSCRLM